jgi:hypothetical protein
VTTELAPLGTEMVHRPSLSSYCRLCKISHIVVELLIVVTGSDKFDTSFHASYSSRMKDTKGLSSKQAERYKRKKRIGDIPLEVVGMRSL